jgi:serine/threonine-protein kinase
VAGKYRLTRLLGKGGMGAVWEGIHDTLGTRVAVKFIDTEYANSDDVRSRFINEAKAAARLRSKHVVQVYDQGLAEDGRPYIVMEFLAGEPLDRRLDRETRLSADETARIVLHVCRALSRAHENGIVHRDLKPENVFLVRDDEDDTDIAKVVDFGIAKFTDTSGAGSSSTRTGAVLGTPQFMSPEQARGLRSVDSRTDLWSLGVIAYRCLVGVLPFKGEAVGDLLVNICTSDAPVPSSLHPDVPAGFDGWVRRALAREPGERFQTAAELSEALSIVCGVEGKFGSVGSTRAELPSASVVQGGAVTASPLATTPAPVERSRGVPWAPLAGIFLVVTALAAFGARAMLHTTADLSAAGSASATTGAASPSLAPSVKEPEVTPVTSSEHPSTKVVEEAPVEPKKKGARAKPSQTPAPTGAKEAAPAPAPRPSRRPDLLGY